MIGIGATVELPIFSKLYYKPLLPIIFLNDLESVFYVTFVFVEVIV